MSFEKAILTVAVTAVCTFLTRLFPFAVFGRKGEPSPKVKYLGTYLPSAVIAVLVIFCLRDVRNFDYNSLTIFAKQIAAIVVVALLHIWKRNNLISIGIGTVLYMVLVQAF